MNKMNQSIILIILIILINIFSVTNAIYCGDIKSVGCMNYCNSIKCAYGYCPLDYKETFSDCQCLSCNDHEQHKINSYSYKYNEYRDPHLQLHYPVHDVSLKYLDHKIKQIKTLREKYPEHYTCTDVECFEKIKEGMIKSHDDNVF